MTLSFGIPQRNVTSNMLCVDFLDDFLTWDKFNNAIIKEIKEITDETFTHVTHDLIGHLKQIQIRMVFTSIELFYLVLANIFCKVEFLISLADIEVLLSQIWVTISTI